MLAYGGLFATTDPMMQMITNIMPAPIIYRWQAVRFVDPETPAYSVMEQNFAK